MIRILLALCIALGLFVVVSQTRKSSQSKRFEVQMLSSSVPSLSPAEVRSAPSESPSELPSELKEAAWAKFKKHFGNDLRAEFLPDGVLTSIRGRSGGEEFGAGDFNPRDRAKVTARARAILANASRLIGIEAATPLGDPKIHLGGVTAHITFQESSGGLPLIPHGAVSIDLGPSGELIGLYSDYVRGLRVTNQPQISLDQAHGVASQAVTHEGLATPEGGRHVIWVLGRSPGGDGAVGKHSYEFSVEGRQVIIDAETGAVIFVKDRRQF